MGNQVSRRDLERRLGYEFTDKSLLNAALIHRSYANESDEPLESNERLEFLGDSILAFLVAQKLYVAFPELSEGELTRLRSDLVRGQALAEVARQLDLGRDVLLSRGARKSGGHRSSSVLADTLEAIVGAIWLDGGLERCARFVYHALQLDDSLSLDGLGLKDHKTQLQEVAQSRKKSVPVYVLRSTPVDEPPFAVDVLIDDVVAGNGKGVTKSEAEQAAARQALAHFQPAKSETPLPS